MRKSEPKPERKEPKRKDERSGRFQVPNHNGIAESEKKPKNA